MNVASWERATSMSNYNGNHSSEEDDGVEMPWHGSASLDDPTVHYRHLYATNQQPLVEYPTLHSVVPIASPCIGASAVSGGGDFATFDSARLGKEDSDTDSDEDRKPAAVREGFRQEASNPQSRCEPSFGQEPYHSIHQSQDQLSLSFDEDDTPDPAYAGVHEFNDGFSEADDFALQQSAGMMYAVHRPSSYDPHPHDRAHAQHYTSHPPPMNYFFGESRIEQPQRQHSVPANIATAAQLPPHGFVAHRAHASEPIRRHPHVEAQAPLNQDELHPSDGELAQAPTPRARRAIETWYLRFNELIEYKEQNGDCNVPQKYEENTKLGIVSSVKVVDKVCRLYCC